MPSATSGGDEYERQLSYCFQDMSAERKVELVTGVIDKMISHQQLRIALITAIPLLPKELQPGQAGKVVAIVVENGYNYDGMLRDLEVVGRHLNTDEVMTWMPKYLARRNSDIRIVRKAIVGLPKKDRDAANVQLCRYGFWNVEETLRSIRAIDSKRLRHAAFERLFFSLLEMDMHPAEHHRSQYTYRDVNGFSSELGFIRDQKRLRALFHEACSASYRLDYAECMIPLFPPAKREAAVEKLVAAHITHHDSLCGRRDAISMTERLSPELRDKYRQIIGQPEDAATVRSA